MTMVLPIGFSVLAIAIATMMVYEQPWHNIDVDPVHAWNSSAVISS